MSLPNSRHLKMRLRGEKILFLNCLFFHMLLLTYNLAYAVTSDSSIGGSFETFTVQNDLALLRNDRGCQHLAAFMMAVDEINNKTDGVNDDINQSIQVSISLGQSFVRSYPSNPYFDGASSTSSHIGVLAVTFPIPIGIVDATNNLQSAMGSAGTANNFGLMTVLSSQGSSTFKQSEDYPTTLQMSATGYMEAAMISNLISKTYGWTKVVIIASPTLESVDSVISFTAESSNTIQIMAEIIVKIGETDFSSVIQQVEDLGATIFLFFLGGTQVGYLMEQGFNAGLFYDGTQVIVPSMAAYTDIQSALTPIGRSMEDIIFEGLLLVVPNPDYHFATPKGQAFIKRFRNLQPTITRNALGQQVCDKRASVSGPLYSTTGSTICLGFESFSSFNQSGSGLFPELMYTYDAVHAIAASVQRFQTDKNFGVLPLNSYNLYKYMTSGIVLSNYATGNVNFQPNAGAREVGLVFKLLNYQGGGIKNYYSSVSTPFIGEYTDGTGWRLCGNAVDETFMPSLSRQLCSTPIYRTSGDGSNPPLDHPADITVGINYPLKVGLTVFASFGLVLTALWACCLYVFWSVKLIRISQPRIMAFILGGAALGLIKVYFV